jgi:hypothetical protein
MGTRQKKKENLYEGKKMRTPWGTSRMMLMTDWPREVRYFGSDLNIIRCRTFKMLRQETVGLGLETTKRTF